MSRYTTTLWRSGREEDEEEEDKPTIIASQRPLGAGMSSVPTTVSAEPALCTAVAVFDYTAQDRDELNFKEGEELEILQKHDSGWWKARNYLGQVGVIPANYLKSPPESSTASLYERSGQKSLGAGMALETTPSTPERALCKAITEFDYTAQADDELSFAAGEELEVLTKDTSGWWKVRNKLGRTGIIPSNYLKASSATSPSPGSADNKKIRVLYDYYAQPYDASMPELTVKEGETLTLKSADPSGWMLVENAAAKSGWIPSNYTDYSSQK